MVVEVEEETLSEVVVVELELETVSDDVVWLDEVIV